MNNNIIKMRVRYLCRHPFIYALLCLLAACTNELEISGDHGMSSETSKIPIDLTAKLAAGENAPVSKVRVIIFSTRSSIPEGPKILVTNEEIDINNKVQIETYVGYNDIYVIGNEPINLAYIKTPQELKEILIQTRSDATLNNVVLFQQLLNVWIKNRKEISIDGKTLSELDIKLQHVMAKLSINFDLNTEIVTKDGESTGNYIDFQSIEIINIPKHSNLIPQIYKSSKQDDLNIRNLTFSGGGQTGSFKWTSDDILLPEYLIDNDTTKRMALRIKGKTQYNTTHTYIVPIGDAMNPETTSSYKWNVTRNRHYKLNINGIKGYGETTSSLETNATVVGWSEISVPIDISGRNFIAIGERNIKVQSLRFYTYTRFTCGGKVTVNFPAVVQNQLAYTIEYDDETYTRGRIGLKRGNWNTGSTKDYSITLTSGTASLKLNVKLLGTEIYLAEEGKEVNWAHAMGYHEDANTTASGFYNEKLFKKAMKRTGCNAFFKESESDPERGQGCWRVATIREVGAKTTNRDTPAWGIEEVGNSVSQAYYSRGPWDTTNQFNYGYMGSTYKTATKPYYCVLDIRPPETAAFEVSKKDTTGISRDKAKQICDNLGTEWRLPTGKEMKYVYLYAGTNGLPNNFFADSYWGQEDSQYIVATMNDPDGSETTDDLRKQAHAVRCLKLRY